jgi:hypothetical protein
LGFGVISGGSGVLYGGGAGSGNGAAGLVIVEEFY